MAKEFFDIDYGTVTAQFFDEYCSDFSAYNGSYIGTYLDDFEGYIAYIYFAGKKAVEVYPTPEWVCSRDFDESGSRDCRYEAEEMGESWLEPANKALMIITDKDLNREEALESLQYCFAEDVVTVKDWNEYFKDMVDDCCYDCDFSIREDLLPDFKALKEGKFVYEGKLVAEIGKGYVE